MSAYDRLNNLCARCGVDADDLDDIINTYADCLEIAEPHAVNAVAEARSVAMSIRDAMGDSVSNDPVCA